MDSNKTDLDTIVNVVCAFDWITPTAALLMDAVHDGPVSHFGILAGIYSRADIWRLLDKHGVESWGYVYNVEGDLIMFSLPEAEAKRAHRLLIRGGMPVLCSPNETAGEQVAPRPSVALSNNVAMQPMVIVPGPSIWRTLGWLLGW